MKEKPTFSEKEFSMPAWLYQMTTNENADRWWHPEGYRQEVREGQTLTWSTGKIYFREQGQVSEGDTVIFFFAKTGNNEPGIYGWGTIIDPPQKADDDITFVIKPPSDFLKDNPCWDDEVKKLLNDIRRGLYVGTMWNITPKELNRLRGKIRQHISNPPRYGWKEQSKRRVTHFDFPPLTDEELTVNAEAIFLELDRSESTNG